MTEVQLQQRDVAEVRGNSFMQEINLTLVAVMLHISLVDIYFPIGKLLYTVT